MKRTSYLTEDDVKKIVDSISKLDMYVKKKVKHRKISALQYQLIFKLMYYCALSVEEVLQLQKSDFDLDNAIITIRNSRMHLDKTTIPPNLFSEISEYIQNLNSEKLFKLTRQRMYDIAKQIADKTDIDLFKIKLKGSKGIHPQFFRNSFRYNMIHHGANDDLADLKLRVSSKTNYGDFTFEHLKEFESRLYKRKFSEKEIINHVNWYKKNQQLYKNLASLSEDIIKKILSSKNIETHNIKSRAKEIESFERKIRSEINFSPYDMQDLAGVRIICYTRSDVDQISEIVKNTFDIDERNSVDKTKLLGETKMGYKSIQFVATLPKSRYELEENRIFKGKRFEIQIRTILQHAWDQIEHDDVYKKVNVTKEVKRRFNLVSSLLEVADNELEELHKHR